MKKRFLIISIITILFISIAIPAFAMDNVANGIRNFVGGTENVLEDAGNNISNGIKNGLNTVSNGTENVMTDVKDGMQDMGNTMAGMRTTDNNSNNSRYTATRTSTEEIRIAGMTTDTWSWIIIGITAAAIGIIVWSYIRQKNKNDIYIDSNDL